MKGGRTGVCVLGRTAQIIVQGRVALLGDTDVGLVAVHLDGPEVLAMPTTMIESALKMRELRVACGVWRVACGVWRVACDV